MIFHIQLKLDIDTSEVEADLIRLIDGPDFDDKLAFDKILMRQFQETQRDVHVRTGSLLHSGKFDSDWDRWKWSGWIEYGGQSVGPNNPVDYAHLEQRRGNRVPPVGVTEDGSAGESHDYMRALPGAEDLYTDAIIDWLDGPRA